MTDCKNLGDWRHIRKIEKRKQTARTIAVAVAVLLLYGFVGYLEQEPAVIAAKSGTQVLTSLVAAHVLGGDHR